MDCPVGADISSSMLLADSRSLRVTASGRRASAGIVEIELRRSLS
jgi:hypothetical protein